jgi:hypothetical protein
MRLGSCLLVTVALLAGASAARGTSPARHVSTGVDIWGQPDRSQEVAGRPLGATIALFKGRAAAHLPTPTGLVHPLSFVAAHLRGNPGALVLSKTRRVVTAAGPIYLVPTVQGWLCVQGPTFQTCHRGLLRQGLTWSFYSTSTGLDVIGIAADNVRAIRLTWSGKHLQARLARNVFFVHRPLSITPVKHLPAFGRLAVLYRGSGAPTTVPLH